jgi:hypothetical protein
MDGIEDIIGLFGQEEYSFPDEYKQLVKAVELIDSLRSNMAELRKIQKKYGTETYPVNEKAKALALYHKGQSIFERLLGLELDKINPEVQETLNYFKKDIEFLQQKGFIRYPQF